MFNCIKRSGATYSISLLIGINVSGLLASPSFAGTTGAATPVSSPVEVISLYNHHDYKAAADMFEQLAAKSGSNGTLFYYGAMASKECGRIPRARQIFDYLIKNNPGTQEAMYAKQMLASLDAAPATPSLAKGSNSKSSGAGNDELPESVKNALPKEMQALLTTEAGRQMVKDALKEQGKNVDVIRQAESKGFVSSVKVYDSGAKLASKSAPSKPGADHPFTPEDIAREGATGIDQSQYPNCWFEASMSALAQLPRGQRMLSNMIRTREKSGYLVRFPGDGVEYTVTEDGIEGAGIHNHAQWASIIEYAELLKFPGNRGANGDDSKDSRLEIGMRCITGLKAELLHPGTSSVSELASFITGAVKTQSPIVCASFSDSQLGTLPEIVVPNHAYTIVDYDAAHTMITIRNPHGRGSEKYVLETDPQHLEFQQMDNGIIKINVPTFQKYFHQVARSFI